MLRTFDNKGELRKAINKILNEFQTGNIVESLSKSYLKSTNIPSDKWSLTNKILMLIAGTNDARSYNAWRDAGRQVQAGVKAFYISAPMKKEIEEFNKETNQYEKKEITIGFRPQPEYRYEDTLGQEIEYTEKLAELPTYKEIAKGLGLSVKTAKSVIGEYGSYSSVLKEIKICTPNVKTFFHELAHAAHDIYLANNGKKLEDLDKKHKEVVAEFSGLVLTRMYGYEANGDLGYTLAYLKSWTDTNDNDKVYHAVTELIKEIEQVLNIVIKSQKVTKSKPKSVKKQQVIEVRTK